MTPRRTTPRVLVAGIGNIFMGDDAFGSEVARRLMLRPWPAGVQVVDFGIRGIDLVYALLDGCELAILVDAIAQGQAPGTLYTIAPDLDELQQADGQTSLLDGHTMDPLSVLRTVFALGGTCPPLLLVGCEPKDLGGEDGRMGLTDAVQASVDEACEMVVSRVQRFLQQSAVQATDNSGCR